MKNETDEKYDLAEKYYCGIDVEEDYEKAFELYSEIAEFNDDAKERIAEMYFFGRGVRQNYKKAFETFNDIV